MSWPKKRGDGYWLFVALSIDAIEEDKAIFKLVHCGK
jgi:hypothetical protein